MLVGRGRIGGTLTWIGEANAGRRAAREMPEAAGTEKPASTVARALAGTLDCAVLAMRYPVEDEFATELAESVYDGLFPRSRRCHAQCSLALPRPQAVTEWAGLRVRSGRFLWRHRPCWVPRQPV